MKKILLSMAFALVAFVATSAASKVIYSWESPTGTVVETGGTAIYENGAGDSRLNYANSGYFTMCLNGKNANLGDAEASANAGHILITFTEALKAGDVINVTAYRNKNAEGKTASIFFRYSNGTDVKDDTSFPNIYKDDTNTDYDSDGNEPATHQITVPTEADGSTTLILTRNSGGTNLFITKFEIVREEAVVEPFKIVSLSPADGSVLASTQTISVSTNRDAEIGYLAYLLKDETTTDPDKMILKNSYMPRLEDGTFQTKWAKATLYEGHQYSLTFTAYASEDDYNHDQDPIAVLTAHYTGSTPEYKYSDVKLVSVSPVDGTTLENVEDSVVTVTFSNKVRLDKVLTCIVEGSLGRIPVEITATNADSTEYTLVIPKASLETCTNSIVLQCVAYDVNGLIVKGNVGEEDATRFQWTYDCFLGVPDLIITPEAGTVKGLKTFKVTYAKAKGIACSYNGNITLIKDRTIVASLNDEHVTFTDTVGTGLDSYCNTAIITLPDSISEAGRYILSIPAGFFNLGQQFESCNCKAAMAIYEIEGEVADTYDITYTPAAGSTVEKLDKIKVTFNDMEAAPSWTGKAYVEDKDGVQVTTCEISQDADFNVVNVVYFTLEEAITTEGTYTLVIPEGVLIVGSNFDNNLEIRATFTVGTATGIDAATTVSNKTVNVYNLNGMLIKKAVPADDLMNITKGVYIVNGKKYVVK